MNNLRLSLKQYAQIVDQQTKRRLLQRTGKLIAEGAVTAMERELGKGKRGMRVTWGGDCIVDETGTSLILPNLRKRKGPNKTEAAFGRWLANEYGPVGLEFEPITLRMPGGTRYTPDWCLRGPGPLMFWEVKGFMREAARVRLKEFAAHFSSFHFYLVRATDRRLLTWNITEVGS